MTAATLRQPTRTAVVARHYLALLGRETALLGVCLAVAISTSTTVFTIDEMFSDAAAFLTFMAFLPTIQWRGGRGELEAALPLGGVRHDLVRVACGLAWASVALVLPVAHWSLGAWLSSYPWWYPLSLLAAGLAFYLLGSAVWLRTARPGRILLAPVFILGLTLHRGSFPWTVAYASREELHGMETGQWIAAAVTWLCVGWAAIVLAAVAGRPTHRGDRGAAGKGRTDGGSERRRAMRRRARAVTGLLPHPASAFTVLRAQAALMEHRATGWPAAVALALIWPRVQWELWPPDWAHEPLFFREPLYFVVLTLFSFLWPLVVWMDDHGPGREHEEALPASVLTRRLARVTAGAVVLLALCLVVVAGPVAGAWIGGTIPSPAAVPAKFWVEIPAAVLMLYLAGSIPLLLAPDRSPRRALVWYLATPLLVLPYYLGPGVGDARFSPTAVFSVFTTHPVPWVDAALLWLAVLAAATVAAAALGARRDRGGPWLPAGLRAPRRIAPGPEAARPARRIGSGHTARSISQL